MNLPDPTTPPTADEITQAHEPIRAARTLADLDALRVDAPENPPALLADDEPRRAPLVFIARNAEAICRSIGIDPLDFDPIERAEIRAAYWEEACEVAFSIGCDVELYRSHDLATWEGDLTIRRFGAIAVRIDADPDELTAQLEIERRACGAAEAIAEQMIYGSGS